MLLQNLLRFLLGPRLPLTSGELRVPGLNGQVEIRRDAYGVPYIRAGTPEDGWYGLGFCHGQDRAFQLDVIRRLVRGRLAEIFGPVALPVDRLSRRIGFLRAAQGHLTVMPDDQRSILDAYVRGVNAGLGPGSPRKAHEFTLLRARPGNWESVDVLAFLNYMGMSLSGWTAKLTRLHVLVHDGLEALTALEPDYPAWLPVTDPVGAPAAEAIDRLVQDARELMSLLGQGASNNWAISGARTATGRPILANDPHLAAAIPPPWYLAHIDYPGLKVCGASFAGIPLIPSGFNGTAAWGVTAGLVDGVDLYVESFDPSGRKVRTGDEFAPCEVLTETYTVRGRRAPFVEEIRITPRGPVISDMLDGFDLTLSMKTTWMNPRPVDGLTNFHRSTDFQTCRENFEHIYLASMNVAYADASGTIGWQMVGEVPRRKAGWGAVPLAGWDPDHDWGTDLIPLTEMPWSMDPETGYLATANNQPRRDGDGPYLGRDWVGYRLARILEILGERDDWDLEKTRSAQLDQVVLPWRQVREMILAAPVRTSAARQALEILEDWDGIAAADSAGAAVYEFFMIAMAHMLAEAKAPKSGKAVLGQGFSLMFPDSFFYARHIPRIVDLLRERPDGWFEAGWDMAVERGLERAHAKLVEALGSDPAAWRWGAVHRLVLTHRLGIVFPLNRILNRGPYPIGGDHQTVNQAGRKVGLYGSNVTGMANLRMAVEVGDWDRNYFILAGGQSGNPLSPHYDDQLKLWLEGKTIEIGWTEEAVEGRVKEVLILSPPKTTT
ncbi:MAG TPA: penicillin acylase family protein [Anaerolineales bacterium]|nr:penicillin acylase family protein [Anaerolineales bacterium]